MKKAAVTAGLRKSKAAFAQPEGSSYAGKQAVKRRPDISPQQATAGNVSPIDKSKPGKIVCAPGSKNCNPFRADKELSRRVR